MPPVKVTIWNEFLAERRDPAVRAVYPDGIHRAIAEGIAPLGDFDIRTATLDEADHGLGEAALAGTDVLVWWGHQAHDAVTDAVLERVHERVLSGMGLVALHSAHLSRIFRRLMGTSCNLHWRESGERERLWNLRPEHPVLEGIGDHIELGQEEMYGERFDIPEPDELLMIGWFQGGEVFRSVCTWTRGMGRVVYLQPGHETHPTYRDPNVLRIIANACRWASRRVERDLTVSVESPALEGLSTAG
jgi:trehalose utilization protein